MPSKKEELPIAEVNRKGKINPFSLTRPKRKTATKTFKDSNHPEVELTITLRSLDQAEANACLEMASAFITRYVGTPEEPAEMAFPMVGGEPVQMSANLVQIACFLYLSQTSDNELERYSVEDFIAFSVTMPDIWRDLQKFVTELQGSSESKNA